MALSSEIIHLGAKANKTRGVDTQGCLGEDSEEIKEGESEKFS